MRFICRSIFECTATALYNFHAGPEGFATLVGRSDRAKVIVPTPSLQPGSRAIVKIYVLPFVWIEWIALHTELEPGKRFVDVQEKGPFREFKHEHLFIELGQNRSILEDRITCKLPRFTNRWIAEYFLENKMKKEFQRRHTATAQSIGCSYQNEICEKS